MITQTANPRLEPNVKQAIERMLRERLAPFGLVRTDIRVGRDQDGDPVLFVDVYYNRLDHAVEAKATFGLASALRNAVAELGETRFPYIRHHFDEHQKIAS
jgi:hypothetical protein